MATTALLVGACQSKEAKLAELKLQCLDGCGKRAKVFELCKGFCASEKVDDCEQAYCNQPKERLDECTSCCEEKTKQDTFVLKSCLSEADLSEQMTAEKSWSIWQKLVKERIDKDGKEKSARDAAANLASAAKLGWQIAQEDGETPVMLAIKEASGVADAKLVLRCAGGIVQVFVLGDIPAGTAQFLLDGVKNKVKLVAGDDGAMEVKLAPSLELMLGAKTLVIESKKTSLTVALEGLAEALSNMRESCGLK
jgi:hypothetical protein